MNLARDERIFLMILIGNLIVALIYLLTTDGHICSVSW